MDYSSILEEFKQWVVENETAQKYWKKVNENNATYKDAEKYSKLVSDWWSDKLTKNFGNANYADVIDDIMKSLEKTYTESAYYSKNVQRVLNNEANVNIKPIEPKCSASRLSNIKEKLLDEDAEWLLGRDVVENIARSAVTDTIDANASFQSDAGLYTYIERDSGSGCCSWCDSMSGRYEYGKQPDDFFRIHKDCTCSISLQTSKNKIQKIRYETRTEQNKKGDLVRKTYKITD